MTDLNAAMKKASDEKKSLLLEFTGSDWCPPCKALKSEVFSKEEFVNGVKDKLVLVQFDFPNDTSKLTEETIAQNNAAAEKYGIEGYPTIILVDEAGKPFASTGYQDGGPVKYVEHLDELLAKRTERDKAIEAANKLEGVERAKALVAVIKSLGLENNTIDTFYSEEVAAIKAADPADESGFVKGIESAKDFLKFEAELEPFAEKEDWAGVLAYIEKALTENRFSGDPMIQATMYKAMMQMELGKKEEAVKTLNEAKTIDPKSKFNEEIDEYIKYFAEEAEKTE